MPANVEFVLGRAGSGKSRKLRYDISNLAREGKRVLLIVNEQFTYENEKMLADKLGGLLTVSVLSFTTLSGKVLRETGCNKTFISPQGRRMLIRKIAEENSGGLCVFQKTSRTPGFSEKCDELFTKCKRFSIASEDLTNAAEKLPENAQLRKKLSDIALLYGKAKEYQEKEYLDSDDLYIELIKRLPQSFAAGSHIFVDNFDRPNKLIYSVMEKLMECAGSLTVSLQLCEGGERDADLFEPNLRAFEKLRETARQLGCKIKITRLPDDSAPWGGDRHNSPALSHLEHELFAWPAEKFGGQQDCVTVFEAGDRVSEAEALASAVEKYIREGYRYREMAVIVPDTESYASAIRREFIRRGIPFFMDAKRPLAGHPVTELMISALRCAHRSFRREDMLRLIKSGLCGLTPDESEIFENFILKYCIRGRGFEEPFPQKEVPPEAESAREKIMVPLLELKQGLSAPTAGEKARALYAYLEKLGVYNALREKVTELKDSGRLEPMEENAQVWNIVMELLSQVDKIMGDAEQDQERFIAVLEEGLGAYEIGVIPTTVDQVLIGTMDRTRRGSVRILFAAGCVDGLLPPVRSDDGVIDDAELKKMGELGLTPWANTEETAEYDRLDLYTSLVKPSDRLWLSYTVNSGKESAPASAFVEKIRYIFSVNKVSGNIAKDDSGIPYDTSSALKLLRRQLREYADFKNKEAVSAGLFAYFLKTERFRPQTESILQALFYDPSSPPLGRELSALLYGRTLEGSASRLETFNKCPYMHFLRYGIKALIRQEEREKPTDEGSFYHAALDAFAKRSHEWSGKDEEKCTNVMDEISDELSLTYGEGAFSDSKRQKARMGRMRKALQSTACAVARQLSGGDFDLQGAEIRFGKNGDYPSIELKEADGTIYEIHGIIDRADKSRDKEGLIRVVDYKSGGKDFKFAKLYEGIDLQLPMYLAAAIAAQPGSEPSGFYYMPVKNPCVDEKDEAKLSQKLSDSLRLTGLTAEGSDKDRSIVKPTVVTPEQMNAVLDFALSKAAETLGKIRDGDVSVRPFRSGNESACRICEFKDACGFDARNPRCSHRVFKTLKQNEFFERLAPARQKGENHD